MDINKLLLIIDRLKSLPFLFRYLVGLTQNKQEGIALKTWD